MPTGYTSDIYEGKKVSGKDFLVRCARAFGACIMMRDEPMDAEIPQEFKPSTYDVERLGEAEAELKKYQSITKEGAQKLIDIEYKNTIEQHKKAIDDKIKMKERYLKTLNEVKAWQPPTDDHNGLKKFAIEQLTESIDFDCATSYYYKEVIKPNVDEWIDSQIERCLRDISYHTKENNAEIERANGRTKWIQDLRKSLEN